MSKPGAEDRAHFEQLVLPPVDAASRWYYSKSRWSLRIPNLQYVYFFHAPDGVP